MYDSDGNILQAVDDFMLDVVGLLPRFLEQAVINWQKGSEDNRRDPVSIVDFGAGTGRNTVKILEVLPKLLGQQIEDQKPEAQVLAVDFSSNMLRVAEARCSEYRQAQSVRSDGPQGDLQDKFSVVFDKFDALSADAEVNAAKRSADIVISTLVMEHLPLKTFFCVASAFLLPGGLFLMTNMHDDMGRQSQAGFVDKASGRKIRGQSRAHTVADVVEGAHEEGLELVDIELPREQADQELDGGRSTAGTAALVWERVVRVEDLDEGRFGGWQGRGRKWVDVKVWYGAIFRKRS